MGSDTGINNALLHIRKCLWPPTIPRVAALGQHSLQSWHSIEPPGSQGPLLAIHLLHKGISAIQKTLDHSDSKSPQVSNVNCKNVPQLVPESSYKQAAVQPPFWSQPPISLKSLKTWQLAVSIKTLKAAGITHLKILLFTTSGVFLFKIYI